MADSDADLELQARRALGAEDWPTATAALRQLQQRHPQHPEVLDLLGFSLVMGGAPAEALPVLHGALDAGGRSPWIPHKLGDAHRALQQAEAAADWFETALAWGSDSPLSPRNLLEVLHSLDPERALGRLERFAAAEPIDWGRRPLWLQGAEAAAVRVVGSDLARWLCDHGCPEAPVRALVWQDHLARLDGAGALALLRRQPQPEEQALRPRLVRLLQGGEGMAGG